MSKAEEAKALFLDGANCSQAVLGAWAKEGGIDRELALKLCSGMGGGMGRLREVCGAATSMFLAADLILGTPDYHDKKAKDSQYAVIQELAKRFREKNGSLICRDLLGLASKPEDIPVSEARTPAYYRKRPCAEIVAIASGILEEYLELKKK